MKLIFLTFAILFTSFSIQAQHTFSIAAVDSATGEIGSAGATCIGSEDGAITISDIVLGRGVVHTQSYWSSSNQAAARTQMEAGLSPNQVIEWLENNDNPNDGGNISLRQYGVVDLNDGTPRSAAYTGNNNFDEKGHRIGPGYAIQGNILISEDVLDDMESAYLNAEGSLADRLMACMQAAKRPGADVRCLNLGLSSGSAFIRVADPSDTNSELGNLSLDINVWIDSNEFTDDPIDELKRKYDAVVSTQNVNLIELSIHPNPTSGTIVISSADEYLTMIELHNHLGQLIINKSLSPRNKNHQIDLSRVESGIYILKSYCSDNQPCHVERIVIRK